MLCVALRGGLRIRVGGRSKKERRYIHIYIYTHTHTYIYIYMHIVDSLCCAAETNTVL